MSDYAKFNATLADVKFNGKKTVVKLELDNKSALGSIGFLMENIDDMVIVSIGDPQMKLEFPSTEPARPGVSGTIASNGVVESVRKPAEEPEEGDLLEEDYASDAVEANESGTEETPDESEEADWGNDGPLDDDMDFASDEEDEDGDAEGNVAVNDVADRQKIEQYIIEEKPKFPEIAFDFPEILREKKENGLSWVQVAKTQGVSSSVLQSAWHKYKGLVTKQMGTAS